MDNMKREKERLSGIMVDILTRSMLANGEISEEDLSDKTKLITKISEAIDQAEIVIIIDHREDILRTAEDMILLEKFDFAIIFFAMYFEHSINHIIDHQLNKKKVTKKTINELIRTVNIVGKFTWLIEILELPKFNDKHRILITKISNERNAFIHYKWNAKSDWTSSSSEKKEQKNFIESIRKTVTYFKKYESRVLYENKKGKLKTAMKKITKESK